jgi:ferritin-like metal-binding protein YciE
MENTMKYEELPEDIQKQIDELKHYAQTIQSDVLDALESTENLEELRSRVDRSMDEIISEAQKVREVLGTGERSVVHG